VHTAEGFAYLSETICFSHITDSALAGRVTDAIDKRACSYCGRSGAPDDPPFAVSMDTVGRLVLEAATWLYHDGYDEFFHEGWPEQYDTDYVVSEVAEGAFDNAVSDEALAHISDAISKPEAWVDSRLQEDFLLSWDSFADIVKHKTRFVYIGARERPNRSKEPPALVSNFLDGLAAYVNEDMFTSIEPGEKLYRARMAEDGFTLLREASSDLAKHLGPAPAGKASAGRLNPEGVGLFYGATTASVAVKETALHSPHDDAVVGAFRVGVPLRILDFTKRPAPPSIFDEGKRQEYVFAKFADDFEERLTQSIRLTGAERVEYVVTQVIGEYFRWAPELKVDGIAWKSHLLEEGEEGKNVLVWAGAEDVRSDPPPSDEDRASFARWERTVPRPTPTLTLSGPDVTVHRAKRSVKVSPPMLPGDDDSDPLFMDLPSSD
jgi:hypothetical protein